MPKKLLWSMKLRMRTNMSSFALVIFAATLFSACNGNDMSSNANAPVVSSPPKTALPMPPLNGKSLENIGWSLTDGTHNAFAEFKGKVLVLDFYATWCAPCRDSVPHLIDLQNRYQNDVKVIGLNVGGPDDADRVPEFARRFKIQYPLGVPDDDLVVLLLAGSDAIPQTFVFDRKGQLVQSFIGFSETTGEAIDRTVENALRSSTD
jgi:cytochrome c biogenesis protein CcmG/thiol:disulfide interchange protein DsbE